MHTGKGKYGDRESIMVNLLNSDELLTAVRANYTGDQSFELYSPYVVAHVTRHGTIRTAIINEEGVGEFTTDDGLIGVHIIRGFSIEMVPIDENIILDLWTEAIYNKSQVDLADHVRVFGDRLEDNFSLWARRIQAAQGASVS